MGTGRYPSGTPNQSAAEYKINVALNAVMALTLTEYTEFAGRLARRFAACNAKQAPSHPDQFAVNPPT